MKDRKWRRRLRGKLADSGGLTLVEMLCATLILALLCVMVSTGLAMAAHQYRMLTAEAETELLVDTIVSALADRLRDSTLSIDAATGAYSHSMGKITTKTAGDSEAGKADQKPAKDTVIIEVGMAGGSTEQKALLPDGAYGAVFSEDAADGRKRRYEVVSVSVSVFNKSGTDSKPLQALAPGDASGGYPGSGDAVTYKIEVEVKDRITGVSRGTPDGGIIVRCLNPVREFD